MKRSDFLPSAGKWLALLTTAAFVLIPMAATFLGGFKTNGELRVNPFGVPDEWHSEFYSHIISDPTFWRYMGNSLVISTATVILTLIFGAAAAYVFAQIRFFGSRYLQAYLLLGLVFPFATTFQRKRLRRFPRYGGP